MHNELVQRPFARFILTLSYHICQVPLNIHGIEWRTISLDKQTRSIGSVSCSYSNEVNLLTSMNHNRLAKLGLG